MMAVSPYARQKYSDVANEYHYRKASQQRGGGVDWSPFPDSPQEQACHSDAQIVGYGGAGGGGKSDALLGKAMTQHKRAIIFRKHFTDLTGLVERGNEILDDETPFVWGVKRRWDIAGGRRIELGAVGHAKDKRKYKGRPHDLIGFDEADEFDEQTFRFLAGWLRTEDPTQKLQIMLCFNPPGTPEGEWLVDYFAPWISEDHPNPAEPGELRWFARVDEKDVEVESGEPLDIGGQIYTPQSRTFIPAYVEDNPFLMATGYDKQLESLPEPLRSQLRYGDFTISTQDDEWQILPTAWILAAQNRSLETEKPDLALRAVGVDPSRGGADETTIAKLYGVWFDELVKHPGDTVPDGIVGAKYVTDAMGAENAPVFVDVIGIGGSVYDHLKVMPDMKVTPVNVGAGSSATDKTRRYGFANLRAEQWWKFREALDPQSGENIVLPNDRKLRIDLQAPHFSIVSGKIKVELKVEIKKRIGRSTDAADAVILAWHGATVPPKKQRSDTW